MGQIFWLMVAILQAIESPTIPVRVRLEGISKTQRSLLRDKSKLVFGNRDRLEVMVAIALSADGMVNASDLQVEIGMAQSRVRTQLLALADAGLLTAFPEAGLKRWYQRNASALWELCLTLYDDWME